MTKHLLAFVLFLSTVSIVKAQSNHKQDDSVAVVNQLNGFIKAFEYFDMDKFQSYFADDVTAFFPPSALVANRIEGKPKVIAVFKAFFERVKQKKTTAPYLDITPLNLRVS